MVLVNKGSLDLTLRCRSEVSQNSTNFVPRSLPTPRSFPGTLLFYSHAVDPTPRSVPRPHRYARGPLTGVRYTDRLGSLSTPPTGPYPSFRHTRPRFVGFPWDRRTHTLLDPTHTLHYRNQSLTSSGNVDGVNVRPVTEPTATPVSTDSGVPLRSGHKTRPRSRPTTLSVGRVQVRCNRNLVTFDRVPVAQRRRRRTPDDLTRPGRFR